ncbi:cytochrome P450 [Streptomyces sp. GMR22]|nr:cytochrome P450 [Streptomyces sp. GMR22]
MAALGQSRAPEPVQRFRYPDGHVGWLVTGHALVRAVLADPRFSSRAELKRTPVHRPGAEPFIGRPAPPGWFIDLDPPDHTRFRRLLAGQFTLRRMNALRPGIERIVGEQLDALERAGEPADLVERFALPVPLRVICELLGVPATEHETVRRESTSLLSLAATAEDGATALEHLTELFRTLIGHKRGRPGDDVLSGLVSSGELSDEEVAGACVLLLTAGHETVASALGLGTLVLLCHEEQLAVLRDGTTSAHAAVEEFLRYLPVFHVGIPRGALEDVELGGRPIRAGDTVTLMLPAANRDPGRFGDPEELDLARGGTGHIAFGYGVHQCIGQHLARIEMRIGFAELLRRFPGLRLAVRTEEIFLSRNGIACGVHRLPVTW